MSAGAGIGAATNIVGGELSGWASLLDKWAMQDAYNKEQGVQQGYRNQGDVLMKGIIAGSGSDQAGKDLAAGKENRVAAYDAAAQQPLGLNLKNQSSFSDTADQAWARLRGQARATLGSYGDWALNTSLRNIQNQESIRQLSSFAGGEASTFPYKLYDAQHSNDQLAEIGAAISSIGGGAANYAQYASVPGQGGGMVQGANGNVTDAYGSQYQMNPYTNQIYSGTAGMPMNQQILNAYSGQGAYDPNVGFGLLAY